jgi:hypothetical protein
VPERTRFGPLNGKGKPFLSDRAAQCALPWRKDQGFFGAMDMRERQGAAAPAVAASQRLCGALGTLGQRGSADAADPLWRVLPPPGAQSIRHAWSSRAPTSRQGQWSADARALLPAAARPSGPSPVSRTSRRLTDVLRPRSSLRVRDHRAPTYGMLRLLAVCFRLYPLHFLLDRVSLIRL